MPSHKLISAQLFSELWQAQCEQIISSANLVLRADEDIEMVHQYRIALRKTRSLLVFMKPLSKVAFFNQVNDQFRQFANHFSTVREWDVLLEYYRETYLKHVEEDGLLTEVLMNEQRKHRLDAYAHFDAQDTVRAVQTYQQDLEKNGFKHKAKAIACVTFTRKRVKLLRKNIEEKEKRLKTDDFKRIHSYRIANKRLRYALELLNPEFMSAFDKRIKQLKAKTDLLGRRCDLYVMQKDLHKLNAYNNGEIRSLNDFLAFISAEMTKNEANG